jgi:hypothetical protein
MAICFRVIIQCDTCGAEFYGEQFETKRMPRIMGSKDLALEAGWIIYTNKRQGEHRAKCPGCKEVVNG